MRAPEGVAIPEFDVAPLTDPESASGSASGPDGVCLPGVHPALPDAFDLELEKALLDVSILPVMVTPLVDPVVGLPEAPSPYPAPLLPELPDDNQDPIARISPLREVADSPSLDVFPSYLVSPAGSAYEPVTSPRDGDLLLGDSTDTSSIR